MKRIQRGIALLLSVLVMLAPLAACAVDERDATKLSFADAKTYQQLLALDGQAVMIYGYMAINAPSGGRHFYLMNTPHATFSVGVTVDEALTSRIEVYPAQVRDGIRYLGDHAVKVVGRLRVAPYGAPFTDSDGYMAYMRIEDATYEVLSMDRMNDLQYAWEQLAGFDFINRISDALNYAHFAIAWNEYSTPVGTGMRYLTPDEALTSLTSSTGQYYYGTSDGYFDRLHTTISSIDGDLAELASILDELERLSNEGLASLRGNNYTVGSVSAEELLEGYTGQKYVPNDSEELLAAYTALYERYDAWLRSFAF